MFGIKIKRFKVRISSKENSIDNYRFLILDEGNKVVSIDPGVVGYEHFGEAMDAYARALTLIYNNLNKEKRAEDER